MSKIRKFWEELKADFSKLAELWKVTAVDCRLALIGEFLLNPAALRIRHHNEKVFQRQMNGHWR
jgi:hypothetical protein